MEEKRGLRVLHTSDWHLGRLLHDHQRDDEYEAFLSWLLDTVEKESVDVVLIAGDIFDTSNAPHAAQQMYYQFCTKLSRTRCRHVVITSGNHDSTSFIDVPKALLACLNVHVVGQARFGIGRHGTPADEVFVLKNASGEDEFIVAAVPFLNESDVRYSEAGEETADKEHKVIAGIARHYAMVAEEAEKLRAGREIPVVAMGHLFVEGGKLAGRDAAGEKDDKSGYDVSERQTYVGTLGGVKVTTFGPEFDYVALGHLHISQVVAGCENVRYSGSPIAMGFGEAGQDKSVCIIDFDGKKPRVSLYPVPCFHKMERIIGDGEKIKSELMRLIDNKEDVYVSVIYNGAEQIVNLYDFVDEIAGNFNYIHCLNAQDKSRLKREISHINHIRCENIEDLDEKSMFLRLLSMNYPDLSQENKDELIDTYNELCDLVNQEN